MASMRTLVVQFSNNFTNIKPLCRSKIISCERSYSVFSKYYIKPVYDKDTQIELEASGEAKVMSHLPIKPAFSNESSSEFHDPVVNKFINYLTREGNKATARNVLEKTFENIKRIQLERYNRATPEEQAKIELDPTIILHGAIENSTPVLELIKMKRGGQTYQVPVPLTEKRSTFLAMNWLILAGKEKKKQVHLPERLAYELIDAHSNQGRVIKKKQELYRQCEANRAYAHFRWT